MSVIKKILKDKPNFGDVSQYNLNYDTVSNPNNNPPGFDTYMDEQDIYENSTSLPENNDKFTKKDLYTKTIGDSLNENIIEANLKFEGTNSIKIDTLYISNTGVDGTVKSNHVKIWIFTEAAYGKDPTKDGYSALSSTLKDEWLIYSSGFGSRDEGSDIGSIDDVEGLPIVSNFAATVESLRVEANNFPGGASFNPIGDGVSDDGSTLNENGAFQTDGINLPSKNILLNEQNPNALYVCIWKRGNKKVAWPINTDERDKKYSIYKISNQDLFVNQNGNIIGRLNTLTFDSPDVTRTAGGGGGARQAAWKVSQFRMSINTSSGIKNIFPGVSDYADDIPRVLPPAPIREELFNSFEILTLINPAAQLVNDNPPGSTFSSNLFGDFAVASKVSLLDVNNNLLNQDFQNYYKDGTTMAFKSSSPATISFTLNFCKIPNAIETDFSQTEPEDNPYKFFTMDNELRASNVDAEWFGNDYQSNDYVYYVIDWNDKEDKIKSIEDYIQITPNNQKDYLEKNSENLFLPKRVQQFNTILTNLDDVILSHTYITPGIKTIKLIAISTDTNQDGDVQTGRWKLVTIRFYLDIPISEYPDFGELGGSDYTTIPWPNTNPIIGGVDNNSKYKISIQDTLSSGKILETDIIDEKFLINDLENDEMGKSIKNMDLEQCRYFNTGSYNMYDLLGIDAVIDDELIQYNNPYYDGITNKFPMESSVGQIFISDNQDIDLKQSCKLELNTGNLVDKSIYDSSGNSNKGLLIGDYKIKKNRKGEPMRRDSFIKVPRKASNKEGAL